MTKEKSNKVFKFFIYLILILLIVCFLIYYNLIIPDIASRDINVHPPTPIPTVRLESNPF